MNPEQLKQYLTVTQQALQPLGEKAQTAGRLYFDWAVKQAYINGFEALFVAAVTGFVGYRALTMARKLDSEYDVFVTGQVLPIGISKGILYLSSIVATIVTVNTICMAADNFLNPEMQAITAILHSIKHGR